MILLKEEDRIKDFVFELGKDNIQYFLKAFLSIVEKRKKVRILLWEVKEGD